MQSREIDFVLVSNSQSTNRRLSLSLDYARTLMEEELQNEGLQIEKETYGHLTYVKLHAPREVLRKYCEIMKFRMPLKEPVSVRMARDIPEDGFCVRIEKFLGRVKNYFLQGDIPIDERTRMNYKFKATYSRDKNYLFDEDNPNFFTPIVRILIILYILNHKNSRLYSDANHRRQCEQCDQNEHFDLRRMISDKIYIAAYPLHDDYPGTEYSFRNYLLTNWAQPKNWYQRQPLDDVQQYLGSEIAFHFAWLGFYMRWLMPASICGVVVLLYGWFTLFTDRVSQQVCNSSNITMCPACDYTCDYYPLSTNCLYSKITYLFDNSFTVVFAFVMAVWASVFLELWKRYEAFLKHRWHLIDYATDEELPRPEYMMLTKIFRKKTNSDEPDIPLWNVKLPTMFYGYAATLFSIMIIVIAVVAVQIYRMWVTAVINTMSYTSILKQQEFVFVSITSSALNLISIMVLDAVYMKAAKFLTEVEMHRTNIEHQNALIMKTFIFQFINSYSSIIYIAFFKGKFTGYPGNYWRIFGARQEECAYGGCFLELSIQLAFIMIGKQLLTALLCRKVPGETIHPDSYLLMRSDILVPEGRNNCCIKDFKLLERESVGLFPEYLKMVLQFGFVTLFVPAFPLAPLFAFISNIFEIRINARNILTYYRRPIPYQVPGIGVWFGILRFLGSLAVLTNGIVIAFSSNFIPKLIYMMNNHGNSENFLMNSLSSANVVDLESTTRPLHSSYSDISSCWYSNLQQPPTSSMKYTPTHFYWQVFIARLIFIILFQNITYAVKGIIDCCIPDKLKISQQLSREEHNIAVNQIIQKESQSLTRTRVTPRNIVRHLSSISTGEPSDSCFADNVSRGTSGSDIPMQVLTTSLETGVHRIRRFSSTSTAVQQ